MTSYFYRHLIQKIHQRFQSTRIIIIVGARQTGKTNITKNYLSNYVPKNQQTLYFDFEKTTDLEIFQDFDHFKTYLEQNKISDRKKIFIAIDEFQYLKNATKFFKIIYDQYPNIKILATGSSAIEIQKHLKESLVGRKKVYLCPPLSFEEFLLATDQHKLWDKLKADSFLSGQLAKLNAKLVNEYLLWGGYPRLADLYKIGPEEKKEELHDIYNSYAQKDIKGIIGGENIMAFNNLVKLLAAQIGNLVNINELSNTTRLSRYDIEKYLDILEYTYIIKRVPPYFTNKRKEISKMYKIYFSDLGLTNMITNNFSPINSRPNLGSLIENYVLNQICNFISISDSLYFWRSLEGAEVDFVWKKDNQLIPIEVKWKNFSTPDAPINIVNFIKKHKDIKEAWVVNKNFYGKRKTNGVDVVFIPAALVLKKIQN